MLCVIILANCFHYSVIWCCYCNLYAVSRGPFSCISFHEFSWQLSTSSLCSFGPISASLVLSAVIIIINPLTARVVGAPQMTLQPVLSIFPCSPLPSGTYRTQGLSIPWCCRPTSSSVCLARHSERGKKTRQTEARLSTIYLCVKASFSPDVILCSWLGLKHQLTTCLWGSRFLFLHTSMSLFGCNTPPALLAEWPGPFSCHCGYTGVERTPNKSQHTKMTLEKKILPPLLPGFELATFRSRVWRSTKQLSTFRHCVVKLVRWWSNNERFVHTVAFFFGVLCGCFPGDWPWPCLTDWRLNVRAVGYVSVVCLTFVKCSLICGCINIFAVSMEQLWQLLACLYLCGLLFHLFRS